MKSNSVVLKPEEHPAVLAAQTVDVYDTATEEGAQELLLSARKELKRIDSDRKDLVEGINDSKNVAQAQAKVRSAPWKLVESILDATLNKWWKKQREDKLKEDMRIKKLADLEKKKLEAKAERAAASGKTEKARLLQDMASTIQAPTLASTPKTITTPGGSISKREETVVTATDPLAFVTGVVLLQFKKTISRMSDFAMGDNIDEDELKLLNDGLNGMIDCMPNDDNEMKYVADTPIFSINKGPLKTAVKTLGIVNHPGLTIIMEYTSSVKPA